MSLKTPSFWYRAPEDATSKRERLLSPLSKIYQLFFALDQKLKKPCSVDIPILCIGNITAGGTGKTPTSIALLNALKHASIAQNPFFLIRGYGGAEHGPLLVDLNEHSAWDVGDEALILAKHAPTIIGGDRVASAELAIEHGADIIIMDDGLQNPSIHKDLKFVVINGEMGFGNQKLMPAGPLRQPLAQGLAIADAFIIIGADHHNTQQHLPEDKPVLYAQLQNARNYTPDTQKPYIAFAGLGYPDKFFNFLKSSMGMNIIDTIPFGDHHPYDSQDLLKLYEQAQTQKATLLTTEKDFMRLPEIDGITVETIPVEMIWDDTDALLSVVKNALGTQI